jgi:predicted NAD/FAD-binding protein
MRPIGQATAMLMDPSTTCTEIRGAKGLVRYRWFRSVTWYLPDSMPKAPAAVPSWVSVVYCLLKLDNFRRFLSYDINVR